MAGMTTRLRFDNTFIFVKQQQMKRKDKMKITQLNRKSVVCVSFALEWNF